MIDSLKAASNLLRTAICLGNMLKGQITRGASAVNCQWGSAWICSVQSIPDTVPSIILQSCLDEKSLLCSLWICPATCLEGQGFESIRKLLMLQEINS
ncbi:hypothetical protein C4D60_Mb09t23040 [Musa balbisiana]|uniref:Uncharacterized protein n=1 Tax=Musa balbisiana TaxID=52838 RepID=A0A4S8IIE3_MUSBA|nr:hypothetical protein C4D60_Mb09t23040 [Musa balbisiana]